MRPRLYLSISLGASIHRSVQNCESTEKSPHTTPRCWVVRASSWSHEAVAPIVVGEEGKALGWTGGSMKSVNVTEQRWKSLRWNFYLPTTLLPLSKQIGKFKSVDDMDLSFWRSHLYFSCDILAEKSCCNISWRVTNTGENLKSSWKLISFEERQALTEKQNLPSK